MSVASSYSAKDITVLEGLEPVRKRPSMYIGGVDAKGLHHLVWEIVDNSVDEYLNGHADSITVTHWRCMPGSGMLSSSRFRSDRFLLQPSRLYKPLKTHRPKHPAPTPPAPSFSRLYPNCSGQLFNLYSHTISAEQFR